MLKDIKFLTAVLNDAAQGSALDPVTHHAKIALANMAAYVTKKPVQLSEKEFAILKSYQDQQPKFRFYTIASATGTFNRHNLHFLTTCRYRRHFRYWTWLGSSSYFFR